MDAPTSQGLPRNEEVVSRKVRDRAELDLPLAEDQRKINSLYGGFCVFFMNKFKNEKKGGSTAEDQIGLRDSPNLISRYAVQGWVLQRFWVDVALSYQNRI